MTNDKMLERARTLAMNGEDDAAKQAYVDVLRSDPSHFDALNELGALACASGHRSAARSAYAQAVRHHPGNPVGWINLGNLLFEDGDPQGARPNFEAALDLDPDFPEAHQGLARVLTELGEGAADLHWHKGFSEHAVVTRPFRGSGEGVPVLLLVSVRNGNVRTQPWINDRRFAITAIYMEFHDPAKPLPPHAFIVNAIGDADLCGEALARAEALVARTAAPVINPPARVRRTGRLTNARRLAGLPGVITPEMAVFSREAILRKDALRFPVLLRSPGFHTGQHFVLVEAIDSLPDAIDALPGDELLAIQYLDTRGPDGMVRKYRVMLIDGGLWPVHLAISSDWKVHYFTADMRTNASFREEERRFLANMPAALGERAISGLLAIGAVLGLDYAGIDFALAPDGSVVVFEANATMVVVSPDPDPLWDYRRRASAAAMEAATNMLAGRIGAAAS